MAFQITKNTKLNQLFKVDYECKQCGNCCRFGSGFLVGDDRINIARFLNIEEEVLDKIYLEDVKKFNTVLKRPKNLREKNMPYGRCIFLKGKICSIHKVKPLNCKIANLGKQGDDINEWFHLNYFVNVDDPISLREWDIHVKNRGGTIPGGELNDLVNEEKIKEIFGYSDLKSVDGLK